MKPNFVLLAAAIFSFHFSFSQSGVDNIPSVSGNKLKEHKVVPWPFLSGRDAMFARRVVRIIDVNEKQNLPMNYPPNPLSLIFYQAVKEGKLVPYQNDSFTSFYDLNSFLGIGNDTEYVYSIVDPDDPSYTRLDTVIINFVPEIRIKRFRIVEDWIFDKSASRFFVRIVSIAPLYDFTVAGVNLGEKELCVFKYYDKSGIDVRHVLVNYEVFNRQTNIDYLSFDDWFEQRLFHGYIVKISNQQDYYINQSPEFKDNGVGALLEAERLDRELHEFEENLFEP